MQGSGWKLWTPARSGVRRAALSVADQGVFSATNFLTLVIVGRACGAEGLGLYALGLNVTAILATFQIAIVSHPYTVYGARLDPRALARFSASALAQAAGMWMLAAALVATAGGLAGWVGASEDLARLLSTLAWIVPPMLLRDLLRRELFARDRFGLALAFDGVISAAQLGTLVALARLDTLTPLRALLVIGAYTGAMGIALLVARRRSYTLEPRQVVPDFKRNWTIGRWLCVSRVFGMLGTLSYPWLLAAFHDTETVGRFAVYAGLCALLNPVLFAIGNVAGPRAARARHAGDGGDVRGVVARASALSVLMVALLAVALLSGGELLVHTVFGAEFAPQPGLLLLFVVNQLLWAAPLSVEAGLNAVEQSRVISRSYGIGAAMTVTVGLVLVAKYGILGAVAAMAATNLITAVYRTLRFVDLTARPFARPEEARS